MVFLSPWIQTYYQCLPPKLVPDLLDFEGLNFLFASGSETNDP